MTIKKTFILGRIVSMQKSELLTALYAVEALLEVDENSTPEEGDKARAKTLIVVKKAIAQAEK